MALGERLRTVREKKGLTLTEVETETKIRQKYILALENEEFDVLPGKVYVKGFMRTYARFLGIDGDALVKEYDELLQPPEISPVTEQAAPVKIQKVGKPRWGLLLIAVIVLIGVAFYWIGALGTAPPEDTAAKDQGQVGGQTGQQEPQPPAPKPKPVQQGVNVKLSVVDRNCWMRIVVDGTNAFEGTVQPGVTKEFQGNSSVLMRLGDAGAVQVTVNGAVYGFLGGPGQPVTKTFAVGEGGGNT